eukprot:gnl/TRDRNA2_/TRDRNA2_184642_c0_seq1.p1 gnl/TRDRNA2_/TRDRNA2_184642_c0~~gnl/TRDRNA2_/TRDRNA2_184642_c0_seq1.p1  ORF type:complete len:222 (-),score=15.52 gnl/TRDRNA2_/TRDRNA2_184642_c0_seq1:107-772(-)
MFNGVRYVCCALLVTLVWSTGALDFGTEPLADDTSLLQVRRMSTAKASQQRSRFPARRSCTDATDKTFRVDHEHLLKIGVVKWMFRDAWPKNINWYGNFESHMAQCWKACFDDTSCSAWELIRMKAQAFINVDRQRADMCLHYSVTARDFMGFYLTWDHPMWRGYSGRCSKNCPEGTKRFCWCEKPSPSKGCSCHEHSPSDCVPASESAPANITLASKLGL